MFNLNSTKDKANFNTKPVETMDKPKNPTFYNLFYKSRKAINALGYGGQVLSAITEFLAVYAVVNNHYWGIVFGLFAVILFEVIGLRIVLKTLVRSIVRKEYKSIWSRIEIGILILVFGAITFGNVDFSLTGNKLVFSEKKDDTTHLRTFAVDSLMNTEIAAINLEYHKKDSIETASTEKKKEATIKTFDNAIKNLNRAKWVEGANKSKINDDITAKSTKKIETLEGYEDDLKAFRQSQKEEKAARITTVKTSYEEKKKGIKETSKGTNQILTYIEDSIYWLLICFVLIAILSIVFEEVFFKGSDIDATMKDKRIKPNLYTEFLKGINDWFYHWFYIMVLSLRNLTNYDYQKLDSQRKEFDSQSYLNNKKKNKENESTVIVEPQPIGFINRRFETAFETAQNQAQSFEVQNNRQKAKAEIKAVSEVEKQKKEVLEKYNLNTVRSWYLRSDKVKKSLSQKLATQRKNRIKYEKAKQELLKAGVKVRETKTTVYFD